MRGNDGISGVEQWGRRVRGRVNLGLFYNCLNCLTGYSGVDLGYFKGKWVDGYGLVLLVVGLDKKLGLMVFKFGPDVSLV